MNKRITKAMMLEFADACGLKHIPMLPYPVMRHSILKGRNDVMVGLERFCERTDWKRAEMCFRTDFPAHIRYYVELFKPSSEAEAIGGTLNEAIIRAVLIAKAKS